MGLSFNDLKVIIVFAVILLSNISAVSLDRCDVVIATCNRRFFNLLKPSGNFTYHQV
jgi:hypothetical protein